MIKLNVCKYCQDCIEFEPQVTQRPEKLNADFCDSIFYGDTIVECVHRRHCEALYNFLKGEYTHA